MFIEAAQQRWQVNSKRTLSVRSFGYFFIEAILNPFQRFAIYNPYSINMNTSH